MTFTDSVFQGLLTEDFEDFDDSLEQYELTGQITTIESGVWHETREQIQLGDVSKPFNVRWRFVDPILSSIILRKTFTTPNPEPRTDFNATIVSHREMQVQVGTQWYDLSAFIAQAIRAGSATARGKTDEDILHTLRQYGFDPTARLPMYLQHLGAGEEAFNLIAADFSDRGATLNTNEVQARAQGRKSQVMASYRHREGIPVRTMEISKANRSLSQTNSGFIGFLDASWGTLSKVLAAHRQRLALDKIIKDPAAPLSAKQAAAARETEIRNLFTVPTSARAFRNWGGTSEVIDILDANAVSRFYAQQVPCGRMTVGEQDNTAIYSVWTISRLQTPNPTPAAEMGDLSLAAVPDASTF